MSDPFGMRDEACWKCIVDELRQANQHDVADRLQKALDDPFPDQAMRNYETMYRGDSMLIDHAARSCRLAGKCQW